MVSKQSIQSLKKVEPSSALCNRCKPKKVAKQVAKRLGHVTRCNLPATCLAALLQHKLEIELHRVLLAVELGSIFRNEIL